MYDEGQRVSVKWETDGTRKDGTVVGVREYLVLMDGHAKPVGVAPFIMVPVNAPFSWKRIKYALTGRLD